MYKKISEIYEAVESYDEGIKDVNLLVQCALGSKINFRDEFTIHDLFSMSKPDMAAIGLTKTQQIKLSSIQKLVKLYNHVSQDRYTIRSPEDAANYLMHNMMFLQQEHFVALFLNTKNEIIKEKTIFIGSLNASIVHPREIFREAVKCSAASIICAHNHPSTNPAPSIEDIEVTKRLVEAGEIIGIEMLDHIIIGGRKHVSLKDKGYI